MLASGQDARAGAGEPYDWTLDGDPGAAAAGPLLGAAEWVAARASRDADQGDVDAIAAPAVVRLAPLFAGVLEDLEAGAAPGQVGARLHRTVAELVTELCRRVRSAGGPSAVALSGGVFQNRLLADLTEGLLEAGGFEVLAAGLVPVNDGGVSLGQAAVAGYTVLRRRGELR